MYVECRQLRPRRRPEEPGERGMRGQTGHRGRVATMLVMGVLLSGCAKQGHPESRGREATDLGRHRCCAAVDAGVADRLLDAR